MTASITALEPEVDGSSATSPPFPAEIACFFEGPSELAGDMLLVVENEAFGAIEQEVSVPKDECHVETQGIILSF